MDVLFKQTVKIREDFNANETGFIKNESNGKIDVQIKEFYGFVEDNHLLRGGYAKIYTDDRGIYFFTEGR